MESERPSISAVMFVYNEEQYIGEMIDSILKQRLSVSEIIIIDDQSTDGTASICMQLQVVNPHIKYIKNKKKGKVNAYAEGLKNVKTDYFFVCAGDDWLFPSFTENLIKQIHSDNLKFLYARYYITDKNLANPYLPKRANHYNREDIIKANRVSGYLFGHSSIIEDILPLPELPFEDWITSLKLVGKYEKITISRNPLFYYRKHPSSTSEKLKNVGMRKRDLSFIEFLEKTKSIIFSKKDRQILDVRKTFCWQLIGHKSYRKIIFLLFSRHLFFIDKIRLMFLLLPWIKDDNKTQKILNKLLKKGV